VCRALGFTDVRTLRAGERATVKAVEVEALRGSLVGPPWAEPQNGYSFRCADQPSSSCL